MVWVICKHKHGQTTVDEARATVRMLQHQVSELSLTPEAGSDGIKVEGRGSGFILSGLIMCVGVVVKVYGPSFDHIAAVGGHFVTPDMFDTRTGELNAAGGQFVSNIKALVADYPAADLEASFHVAESAGKNDSQATIEGKQAAGVLIIALGMGGKVHVGPSRFKVTV
jgi:hypothetical protein